MSIHTTCSTPALECFAAGLSRLESTAGLVQAAIGVSMHALDDVEPARVEDQILQLALRVDRRVHGRQFQARLAHLHDVLFEEEGFFGNSTNYYSPLNSYLPAVLASRRGIPVTLALVYKAVAEHLGIDVVGLNTPYHFLVEVRDGGERMIVDPFLGGRILTLEDVHKLLLSPRLVENEESLATDPTAVRSATFPRKLRHIPAATHRQWLARILANLQHIFGRRGFCTDHAAMTELQQMLEQHSGDSHDWSR
jgi:regulator of sirC expression with transglutaminase-like and TPR domain